jgi:hypothetical protein
MRACSTGVFGSRLLLCAPTIGAVRGGGVKNCAPPLESEHESSLRKNWKIEPLFCSVMVAGCGDVLDHWRRFDV